MSDSMGPLETATIDELMDEIKRRSTDGIIIVSGHDPKSSGTFIGKSWGSNMWKVGACRFMERMSMKDLDDAEDVDDALEP